MITTFLVAVILSWVIGKGIKTALDIIKEKKLTFKMFFCDGPMPSTHTTSVVAVAAACILETGISPVSVLSVVVALLVMEDAMKVRWITGQQSKLLNQQYKGKKGYTPLLERVGHRPIEVFAGGIIGVVVPVLVYLII